MGERWNREEGGLCAEERRESEMVKVLRSRLTRVACLLPKSKVVSGLEQLRVKSWPRALKQPKGH